MRRSVQGILFAAAISTIPAIAAAHISISSGPGQANATQILKFGVGHGCEGLDTYSVKIDIPAGVTSVRAMPSDFGKMSMEKDAAGSVKSITWTRSQADLLSEDLGYYELLVRARLPDAPFTTIFFPTHQYCLGPDGGTVVTDWVGTDPNDTTVEPAPAVKVAPARKTGWNKIAMAQATTDLAGFFSDAVIVWKGNAAFSPNATTTDLIKNTAGVTALTAIAAGDEVWVKY
ncbi:MAG: DUF1775 domain-containing protein [Polyangiaceae bacterium]